MSRGKIFFLGGQNQDSCSSPDLTQSLDTSCTRLRTMCPDPEPEVELAAILRVLRDLNAKINHGRGCKTRDGRAAMTHFARVCGSAMR